jgi:hypothetical protein
VFADQQELAVLRKGVHRDTRAVEAVAEEEDRLRRAGGPGYPAWKQDDRYARREVRRRFLAARAAETAAEEAVARLAALGGRVEQEDEGLGGAPGGEESEGRREEVHQARIDDQVPTGGDVVVGWGSGWRMAGGTEGTGADGGRTVGAGGRGG